MGIHLIGTSFSSREAAKFPLHVILHSSTSKIHIYQGTWAWKCLIYNKQTFFRLPKCHNLATFLLLYAFIYHFKLIFIFLPINIVFYLTCFPDGITWWIQILPMHEFLWVLTNYVLSPLRFHFSSFGFLPSLLLSGPSPHFASAASCHSIYLTELRSFLDIEQ